MSGVTGCSQCCRGAHAIVFQFHKSLPLSWQSGMRTRIMMFEVTFGRRDG
jgi:hypothetical protein